jgi:hypothetical protein
LKEKETEDQLVAEMVVIGAGFAGCAAAISAAKAGAKVTLLERMDMLTGIGLAAGVMRTNGRFTAAEEMIAMGGGDMFEVCDSITRHHAICYPGQDHLSLYDVLKIESATEKALKKAGVEIRLKSRARDVKKDGEALTAVVLDSGEEIKGDAFVDTTGTAGGMANCRKYGYGCVCCFLRCPTFGGRVSIASKAGVKEKRSLRGQDDFGGVSSAFHLAKESVDPEIIQEVEQKGVVMIPLPPELVHWEKFQHLTPAHSPVRGPIENMYLLDNGLCKITTQQWMPLEELRSVKGFEYARMIDPYSGGIGNSIRFMAMTPRDNTLQVKGVPNLFCAGEKAGQIVGLTEAIVTGVLAGHNAVRRATGKTCLELPRSLCIGDYIAYVPEYMQTEEGQRKRISFRGGRYFNMMKESGAYTTDIPVIHKRVADAGLTGVFAQKIV